MPRRIEDVLFRISLLLSDFHGAWGSVAVKALGY
jgi:hypothetical protein